MKAKNIEVIKALCNVAYTDGNYLQSSWIDVRIIRDIISRCLLVFVVTWGVRFG